MQISSERRAEDDDRAESLGGTGASPEDRELLDPDEAIDLAELFRLLGDPTRIRILFGLLEAGELCVRDIADVVSTSETKVSQAMRLLRGAGVVRNRRAGRNVYYRLDDDHVVTLLRLSREHLSHGSSSVR